MTSLYAIVRARRSIRAKTAAPRTVRDYRDALGAELQRAFAEYEDRQSEIEHQIDRTLDL